MDATRQIELLTPRAPADALPIEASPPALSDPGPGRWLPDRVVFTAEAAALPFGQRMRDRAVALGLQTEVLCGNRIVGLRGKTERETYRIAKRTLSVVTAPAGQFKLQPIPPSADWQFHLAQGCPAHCQYCYLAGSLAGPPTVRVYATLPEILANLPAHVRPEAAQTTFEASCYTDPLALEHLTGSLSEAIRHFGSPAMAGAQLRWVTKFADVEPLLGLDHRGRTRARFSINAEPIASRFEGGTAPVAARLAAAARLAQDGYPIGLVVAPIMPLPDWRAEYGRLLDQVQTALPAARDMTIELITHRFTAGSKQTLRDWYPGSRLEMDESTRAEKRGKFGGSKYVYRAPTMRELRDWFEGALAARFPRARVLYWT